MFQYIPQAGSPNWTVAMDITLPQYSAIATSNFSAGSTIGQAVITIPKISLTNDADYEVKTTANEVLAKL
jgi:hypothetical protein